METLTNVPSTKELATLVWSADRPCEELNRNMLAASADAFTHLGEIWDSVEVFMDGSCNHDIGPHLASAAWGVTDGVKHTSGLVLGQQTAMIG